MELYAGLDLHSRNTYIGIMDKTFNRVFKKRVPNHLEHILQTLDPFRDQIKGFVVESTYATTILTQEACDKQGICRMIRLEKATIVSGKYTIILYFQ
jgi:hypothetical protein